MSWLKVPLGFVRVFKDIGAHDLSGAATEMAYKLFFAMLPFLLFLATLGAFASDVLGISNPTDQVMNAIGDALPADAASVLRSQVSQVVQAHSGALLSVSVLGALWSASSAIGTVIKALNRVAGVKETRSLWQRYGIAVGLTAAAGSFITAAFVLQFAGQWFGNTVGDQIGLAGTAATGFSLLRWPAAFLLLVTAVSFLYWAAPNVHLPWKWLTPGSLLAVLVWLVGSYLFGLYVANFGSYNATYGALGGVILLLTWLYLSSFVVLIGFDVNTVLASEIEEEPTEVVAARHAPADAADSRAPPNQRTRRRAVAPSLLLKTGAVVLALLSRRRRHPTRA